MDVKNLVMAVVGMVLAAVMIGGALLPAVGSAGRIDIDNEVGTMSAVNANDTHTFRYDTTANNGEWYVDDVLQTDILHDTLATNTFILSDTFTLYSDYASNTLGNSFFIFGDGTSFNYETSFSEITISIDNGVYTATIIKDGNTITKTGPYSWCYYGDSDGDYRIVTARNWTSQSIYFNDPEDVLMSGAVWGKGWYVGTITDLKYNGQPISNVRTNFEKLGEDVYKANVIRSAGTHFVEFTVEIDGVETDVTPNTYIVPKTVTGSQFGFSPSVNAMFGVLPLVAIAGLVMAGIYVFITRK